MRNIFVLFVLVSLSSGCYGQQNNIQKAITDGTFNELEEPSKPEATEFYQPVPSKVDPAGKNGVPSDAIVLFDGSGFDSWERAIDGSGVTWSLSEDDKSMTVKKGKDEKNADIQTKQKFGSVQLHLEWKSPSKIEGKGQHRGNSGVFLQGRYEVQILDNNDNKTYVNGQVGSIYKQSVPLVMASVSTGQWNTYDIIYHAPEFNSQGVKSKSATITVLHNGVLVQDHFEIKGSTQYIGWPENKAHGKASIRLQDHGSAVSYRNIWVRPLD